MTLSQGGNFIRFTVNGDLHVQTFIERAALLSAGRADGRCRSRKLKEASAIKPLRTHQPSLVSRAFAEDNPTIWEKFGTFVLRASLFVGASSRKMPAELILARSWKG